MQQQHTYLQHRRLAVPAADPRKRAAPRLTTAQYRAQQQRAIATTVADEVRFGKCARTQRGYEDAATEFAAYLDTLPAALASWDTVSPFDVLTYVQ